MKEITKEEFLELKKDAVHSHVIGFTTPAITFFWNAEGYKNKNLSFGKHAYLAWQPESKGPEPYVWKEQFWKID